MTAVRTGDRIVASVIAADSGDWQVVSTPVGFNGFTAPDFAENDLVHGFLIHEDGEQWEVYDFKGADATHLLEILSLSGTVTLGRPAVPSRSSNSDGSRIAAGSGTHTLVVEVGADSVERTMRETSPFVKTFTAADATPSIADHRFFKTNGTTAITRLDDKIDGQRALIFRGDADITFHHNGTDLDLVGGADFTLTAATPAIEFIVVAGVAKQISGTRLASAVTAGDTTSAVTPDAVKTYVDQVAAGLNPKAAAKVATTANITLSGAQTIDGVAVVANDRVLVKNQSTASQNGLYDVKAGSWSRSGDMDAWAEVPSAYVWVAQGTANADTGWVCTSDVGGTIGSTAITWVQFGGANYVSPAVQAALDLKAPLAYTPAGGGAVATTAANVMNSLYLAPERYGAIGDGTSHPVSEWVVGGARDRGYANLAAITAIYSHVSSLTDQIDWAAITQTLSAMGKCVLGSRDYYVGGNKLTVGATQRLEGSDPTSAIDGSVGSRVTGALSSASIVAINGGGGNLPSVLRGVHVKRASGSIPSGSEGVTVEAGDNVLVEDLYISHHAVGFRAEGQLNLVVNRVCVADVSEAYFDVDSIEVTLSECRAGRNGLTSGAFGGHYCRIGANTDTLNVFSTIFAEPSGSASDCIFFSNYSNPNGIFNFTNCHWEAFSNFIVTNSTTTAQRLSITSCTATNATGTPNLIAGVDSPIGDIKRLRLTGSIFDGSGWVFELPTVTGEITTCYFVDTVVINAGAVAFTGNTVKGNINITGDHNGTSVVGNVMPGTFAVAEVSSPTGDFHYGMNICDDAATNAAAIAIKTVGNIRSGGYLYAGAYIEAATYVKAASSIRSTVDIGTAWTFSDDAAAFTLANGGSKTLADGSGIIVVTETTAGKTAVFATGGANIQKIAGAAEWVAGAPSGGQMGLNWNGTTAYIITNNMGADRTFHAGGFRVRPAN